MSEVEDHVSPVAAATLQRDLIRLCIDEFKALPEVWQQMNETEQDEVIERLKKRMNLIVSDCVQIVACHGFTRSVVKIEQLTIKEGIKAVVKISDEDPNRHVICDSVGRSIFIVLADLERYEEGLEQVKADPDQQELALRRVNEIGRMLGAQPDPDAPSTDGALPSDPPPAGPDAPIVPGSGDTSDPYYAQAVARVRGEGNASISFLQRALQIGYNRAAGLIELLQDNGIVSGPDAAGRRKVIPFVDDSPSAEG